VPARRVLAALVVAPLVLLGACGGDDETEATPDATTETTAANGDQGNGDGPTMEGPANPCDAVTQEQFAAIFGADSTKADASGTKDRCSVLTSGGIGQIEMQNLATMGTTSFDDAVATYQGCTPDSAKDVEIGDKAVVDTSCLPQSGTAQVIVDDGGDILRISMNIGEPAQGDTTAVGDAFVDAATAIVDAR
jgi:hypothetical protein